MCGIAGLAYRRAHDFRQEAERRVQTMIDVQAHRGPDGEGLWSTSIGATGVTLGQKRLAIQDLSSAGAQPMLSECGGYALNYNGELCNAVELRRLLEHEGAVFHSRCDTEVVLRALMHWGDAALERFNGMWALAFVDVERRRVTTPEALRNVLSKWFQQAKLDTTPTR